MSFAQRSVEANLLSDVDIRSTEAVILRTGAVPIAAVGVAVTAAATTVEVLAAAQEADAVAIG